MDVELVRQKPYTRLA